MFYQLCTWIKKERELFIITLKVVISMLNMGIIEGFELDVNTNNDHIMTLCKVLITLGTMH